MSVKSPFKADRHFTRGRREFHRKKVNGKSGFEMKLTPLKFLVMDTVTLIEV